MNFQKNFKRQNYINFLQRLRNTFLVRKRSDNHINLWLDEDGASVLYYPPTKVDEADLDRIVSLWEKSNQSDSDAWLLFARLAKLQPFPDGNKRTALIAANHALGAFQTENYLMPPTGRKYVRFKDALLGFYGVGLHDAPDSEEEALQEFLKVAPSRTKIT